MCGNYQITSSLGAGGMGEVWQARHHQMQQDAAIKLINPALARNDEMVRRFMNEARAAAAVPNNGIVRVYDMGFASDNRPYIAMELLRGETLDARLSRQGQMSVEQATRFVRQLAQIMEAAHSRNILHRDLKPENLFIVADAEVDGGERIKVLDFGLAKLSGGDMGSMATKADSVFGSPRYMAKEQCLDSGAVDHRADLYSIGCIFYHCVCGRPPFTMTQPAAVLVAQVKDPPPPPSRWRPDLAADMEQLILRLLAKEPADRLQSCTELVAALDGQDLSATVVDTEGAGSIMALVNQARRLEAVSMPSPPQARNVQRLTPVGAPGIRPPQPIHRPVPQPIPRSRPAARFVPMVQLPPTVPPPPPVQPSPPVPPTPPMWHEPSWPDGLAQGSAQQHHSSGAFIDRQPSSSQRRRWLLILLVAITVIAGVAIWTQAFGTPHRGDDVGGVTTNLTPVARRHLHLDSLATRPKTVTSRMNDGLGSATSR